MKRKILHNFRKFFAVSLALATFGFAKAQTVDILANPSASSNVITGSGAYHLSECIYQESEIGAANFVTPATAINHIEVYVGDPYPLPVPSGFSNFVVYMKNVPLSSSIFVTGVWDTTGYTRVYAGSLNIVATGWFPIDLGTSFSRSPGTNLSVMFTRLDGVARTTSVGFVTANGNTSSATATSTRRYNSTVAPVFGVASMAPSLYRAAIRLVHSNPADAALTGIVVPPSTCSTGPYSVDVTITNNGTSVTIAPGTAAVAFYVAGANTYTAPLLNTTSIAPGGTETLTFSNINLPNTGYNIAGAIVTFPGDGDHSNDTAKASLSNTPTTTTFPITEGAETTPPDYFGYLKLVNGSTAWLRNTGKIKNNNLSDSLAPHSGTNFYYFNSFAIETSDEILYSNCLSLPAAGGNNNFYISFWMSHDTSYSAAPLGIYLDSIYLVISTNGGATWTRLAGYQRNDPAYLVPGWKNHQVDIPAYAGQTIQIGFEGVSQWGNIIGLDDITVVADGALPVKLISFTGERAGSGNQLSWVTVTEANNKGFELQRSVDGVNFSKLSFINSKAENGNSTGNLKYDFYDNAPFATSNYYRLKQIDKDGRFEYSKIVLVKGTKPNALSVAALYPNPAVDNLNLMIASPSNSKVSIVVSDLAGKIIMQNAAQLVAGENQMQLNVKALAKGSYSIKVVCADGCNSPAARFVKQ